MAFDPLTAVLNVGGKIIDRVWPDPTEKAKAQLALFQLQQSGELQEIAGQLEVNKVEAASNSLFVAGWRPWIGWVCGIALFSDYVVRPFFMWGTSLFHRPTDYPMLNLADLLPLVFGMLGMAAARSYDKSQGTDNGH